MSNNSISSSESRNMDLLSEVASAAKNQEINLKKSTAASKTPKKLPLPVTLMKLLNDETAPDAIWWLPGSSDEFAINSELFTSQVLGVHLPASKYSAFMRRLRKWGFTRQSTKYLKKIYRNQIPPKTVSFRHRHSCFDKKKPELLHHIKSCAASLEDDKAAPKKVKATSTTSKKSKKMVVVGPAPPVAVSSSSAPLGAVKAEVATPTMVPSIISMSPPGQARPGGHNNMDDVTATNLLMQFGTHNNSIQNTVPKFPGAQQMIPGHPSLEDVDLATFSLLLRQEQLRQLQEQEARLQEEENERQVYAFLMQQRQQQQEEAEQQQQRLIMEALLVQEHQNRLQQQQQQQQISAMTGNYTQDDLVMLQLLQLQQQQQQNLGYHQNAPDLGRFF